MKNKKFKTVAITLTVFTTLSCLSSAVYAMPDYWPDDGSKPTHFHGGVNTIHFANQEELLTQFDTIDETDKTSWGNDVNINVIGPKKKEQKVYFGKGLNGEPQKWYIVGEDPEGGLAVFADSSMSEPTRFSDNEIELLFGGAMRNPENGLMTYDASWGATYSDGIAPDKVYSTNYWANSNVRHILQDLAKDPKHFSEKEMQYMLTSTIKTLDNRKVYLKEHKQAVDEMPDNPDGYIFSDSNGYVIEPGKHDYYKIPYGNDPLDIYQNGQQMYYTTEDILYAPYADAEETAPTIGSGGQTLSGTGELGLMIGQKVVSQCDTPFWTRSPSTGYADHDANINYIKHVNFRNSPLYVDKVKSDNSGIRIAGLHSAIFTAGQFGQEEENFRDIKAGVQPAFRMNIENVLFGSRVLPVSQTHTYGEVDVDPEAMTLRYKADDLGEAKIVSQNGGSYIELSDIPESYQEDFGDIRLIIQVEERGEDDKVGKSYAWSCKAENGKRIYPQDVTVDNRPLDQFLEEEWGYEADDAFMSCEVWLETTDYENRISLAKFPKLMKRYVVETIPGQNMSLTSAEGTNLQEVVKEDAITEIVYTADKGYQFPKDYMQDKLANMNGIKMIRSEDGKTVTFSGVPTADTTIELDPLEKVNLPPEIHAKDIHISVGDMFDKNVQLKDVTASDFEDGPIPKEEITVVKHTVPVDNKERATTAGTYEITYRVSDSQGLSTTATAKVVVKLPVPTGIHKENHTGMLWLAGGMMALGLAVFEGLKRRKRRS